MAYLGQVGREANSASALSVGSAMTIIVAAVGTFRVQLGRGAQP